MRNITKRYTRALYSSAMTLTLAVSAVAADPTNGSQQWLGFRGNGTGSAVTAPEKLNLAEGGNLAWKRSMPGRSVSSPIIVGDRVITTSSAGLDGHSMFITAVSLKTGDVLWEQSFMATGRPYCHPTSANAAPTPVSDGKNVYAFFSSNDLVGLTVDGDLLWYRGLAYDYPKAGNDVGMASSPVVAGNTVVVQVENQGDSFVLGVNAQTGENLWRNERPRDANWSSPAVVTRGDGRTEVVVQCGQDLQGLDPQTGKALWQIAEGCRTVPSATPAGKWLLVPARELMALDMSSSAYEPTQVWRSNKLQPANASVVTSGDRIYTLKGSVLLAGSLETGEVVWQQRLAGISSTWATPVVAQKRIYVFDQTGKATIIEDTGDKAEQVAELNFEEPVLGSPAVAQGRLVVRGENTLYCFE